jgi:hypothetical protein
VAAPSELERDLQLLATELRRLEAEYNMYFGGRVPRPPVETRARVETLLKRLDRAPFDQLAQRFRLQTLQSRFATFAELWDRGIRSREEGRPRRASRPAVESVPAEQGRAERGDRVLHEAAIDEIGPAAERIRSLYAALVEARRESGQRTVPFARFAELVDEQVRKLREEGAEEVAFRLSVSGGRVRLTARATKNVED